MRAPALASVWLVHGLYSKLPGGSPRHLAIVQSVPGLQGAVGRVVLLAVGATEVAIAIWLNFEQVDPDHVVLRGTVSGASIVARLERVDERNYLLLNRGFHWIQEKPFNR